MSAKARLPGDEDLRRLLASRGVRVTERRLVLLRELAKLRVPTSHPELSDRLSRAGLDRATVYRNLVSLTEAGLLVKLQLGDNVSRFQLPGAAPLGHAEHPHFVCVDCGEVACLPADAVALRGVRRKGRVAEIQLRGQCRGCLRQDPT